MHYAWGSLNLVTNDRALFAMFARSNLNYQEPGNAMGTPSCQGRGEERTHVTCHMSSEPDLRHDFLLPCA